jgi:hypothetical protein
LIREQADILHLGVINITDASNNALVTQQKDKVKNPKKHHPYKNKQKKSPKPSYPAPTPNVDKGTKSKGKNTKRHCNFCGQDGHLESKCFEKIKALQAMMKKHNINFDYFSSKSSSHGHALFASSFSFNATSTSSSNEWLGDYGTSYHMDKDKTIFSTLNECNTKQIFVGDNRSLIVVGSRIIQVDDGHFNDVYVFQVFPATFYQFLKSFIQVKVKQHNFHVTKL